MITTSKFGAAIRSMIFPRKCPLCGRNAPEGEEAHLCQECARYLSAELEIRCPVCRCRATECRCTPKPLRKAMSTVGDRKFIAVGFYQPKSKSALLNRLIYTVKNSTDDTAARVLARMLSKEILKHFLKNGEEVREWIITYPPRRRRNKRKTGVDQAKRIARFVAKDLGAEFEAVFTRKREAEQKRLSKEDRIKSAADTYAVRSTADCCGKRYILCDDILTSGATLSSCAEKLIAAGAIDVFAATALYSLPKGKVIPYRSDVPWFNEVNS